MKTETCLYCNRGSYCGESRVICYLYDMLVMENDYCGLWERKE